MKIPQNFIDILCCPKRLCRGTLLQISNQDKFFLKCEWCNEIYHCEEGIPILYPNVSYSPHAFKRHWDLTENAQSYAAKYDSYLKKQGTPWGLYTHTSELEIIDKLVRHAQAKTTNGVIIDAGCGNGRLLSYYEKAKCKIGIDTSLTLLKAAKKRDPSLWLICGQLEDMPIKDAVADLTVSIRVFQHILIPEDAFSEMTRVTKPAGHVMLEVYNKLNLKEIYKRFRMLKWVDRRAPWGLSYDRYFSYREISSWCQKNFVKELGWGGAGWGWHFYILDFIRFRKLPAWLQQPVFSASLWLDRLVNQWPIFRVTMEKLTFIGSVQSGTVHPNIINKYFLKIKKLIRHTKLNNIEKILIDRNYCYVSNDLHHLNLTFNWLKSAQDSSPDSGLSRGNSLVADNKSNKFGWQPSYPETTGYSIPTFIKAGQLLNDADLLRRAEKMAQWEIGCLNDDGSVHGGNIASAANKAVFDSGQVLRGLIAIYSLRKNPQYLVESTKIGNWMLKNEFNLQGCWLDNNATCVNQKTTTYNVYAAPPLVELSRLTGNVEFQNLAKRVADYTLNKQMPNGWFTDCDFAARPDPLLHTIAYTIDGLWDLGEMLGELKYSSAARRAIDALYARLSPTGNLPGRLDNNWNGTVSWACLTGLAQIAITGCKISKKTGDQSYFETTKKIKEFLKSCQNNLDDSWAGGRGAMWGSWPISGDYGKYEAPNWAAKYFADLLIHFL